MDLLSLPDIIICIFWIFIIITIGLVIRNTFYKHKSFRKYFFPALILKMLGAISVGLIYGYYYYFGDTFRYHYNATRLANTIINDPSKIFQIFFGTANDIKLTGNYFILYAHDPHVIFTSRLLIVPAILAFNSYLGMCVIVAGITFIGVWLLFRVFHNLYPSLEKEMAISALFIPSVFFWGSGILKDSFTLLAIGLCTYCIYKVIISKNGTMFYLIVFTLSSYIMFMIKPYIFLSFLPMSFIWIGLKLGENILNPFARFIFGPMVAIIIILSGILGVRELTRKANTFEFGNVLKNAANQGRLNQFATEEEEPVGSNYDLAFNPTVTGVITYLPLAVFTTFYRPLPFEVRKVIQIPSAIEGIFLLFFSLRVIFTIKPFDLYTIFKNNPFLTFAVLFSILFAMFTGLSSGNFGNLVRYKIPCEPFFVASLFIIRHFHRQTALQRKRLHKERKQKLMAERRALLT